MSKYYLPFSKMSIVKIILIALFLSIMPKGFAFQNDPVHIEMTGYTEDVIANGVGPMMNSTTDIVDSDSFCFLSEDWKLNADDPDIAVGLPADGLITSPDIANLTYQIPNAATPYEVNNSLRIDNTGTEFSGTLTLDIPDTYSKLYFLVVSGSGSSDVDVTVNFMDGTSEDYTGLTVPDWYQTGLPVEASGFGRGNRTTNDVENPFDNPKLFRLEIDISVTNQLKSVESVIFSKTNISDESVLNVMASSGQPAGDCLTPYDIVVSGITTSEASIDWSSETGNTEWEVIYGEADFDPENTGTTIEDNDGELGVNLTDLTSETDYDVYVKAICGSDDESDLAGPESFTTLITPPENNYLCDAIALIPNNSCTGAPYTTIGAFSEPDEPTSSCLNNFQGTNTVWFSFEAPSNGEATVTTDFTGTGFSTEMVVFEAPTDCADMSTIGDEVGCAGNGADADLTGLTPGDTYYVQVKNFNEAEGNFCIEVQADEEAPCHAPTDIIVDTDDITGTSADVSWTPNGNETQWKVIYGEVGFDLDANEGTSVVVNDTPTTTITDLNPTQLMMCMS